MFQINPFIPPRISPTDTKLYDLENEDQGHYQKWPLKTLVWTISDSLYINNRVQESVYLQLYTTLTLPTIVHLQQLYGIGLGRGIGV